MFPEAVSQYQILLQLFPCSTFYSVTMKKPKMSLEMDSDMCSEIGKLIYKSLYC